MNLSTPTPIETSPSSASKALPLQKPHNHSAVIENDWVPAIQLSEMHHANPVRLAGPLRPKWYIAGAKNLLFKVVRSKRQTAGAQRS